METLWRRLESWIRENAPEILATLQPGATTEELQQAEDELRVALPKSVRDFYRIHNGQATDKYGFTAQMFLYGWQVPNLKRVVHQWKGWKEVLERGAFQGVRSTPDKGVRNDWWNVKWIPVTQNASGDHLCIDLAPAKGGAVGQMISVWHDAPERSIVGASFQEWVERFATGLEKGAYVYSKSYGGIIEAAEASYYDS
ncbi:MAG TPA: SMI1/KNR4 family protein [Gemmataceae bacterium]|nr:SMI1/KNR4 family protein [Gemmataceae bacterium]